MARRRSDEDDRPASLQALGGPDDWASIRLLAGAALPGAEVVKVVVDRRPARSGGAPVPHFLDTTRFQHHVDFCRRLDPSVNASFDTVMYRSPDRPFVLLTMTRLPADADRADDLWWLELWPGDDLAADEVVAAVVLLRDASGLGDRLRFKAASDEQRRRLSAAPAGLQEVLGPLLDQGAVRRGASYQGLTTGTAHGRLRVLTAADVEGGALRDLTAYDVVVTEVVPLEIGPVAALVTAEQQTPLAHVAVLSANRGSPNCSVRGAHERPDVRALEGAWVRLVVERDGWTLEPVDEADARAAVDARRARLAASAPGLERDLRRTALVDLRRRPRGAGVVGAKAASLARWRRLRPVRRYAVPGFTVPLAHQVAHVARDARAAALLDQLDRAATGRDDASVTEVLAALRAAVRAAPVDPGLVAEVRAGIEAWRHHPDPLFAGAGDTILRSSSNCEDLPGFNGAGLADSVRLGGPPDAAAVADTLREVWASLWTDRAWAERATFGLDQSRAAMAVLVQPVVPHAAHVVAVTTNTVKPGAVPASLLNLLPAGGLVTDAASASAEQLLLFDDDPACAEVLALAAGEPASLLPDPLLGEARDLLRALDRAVRRASRGRALAADVELLVLEEEQRARRAPFVLLQARPWGVSAPSRGRGRARGR